MLHLNANNTFSRQNNVWPKGDWVFYIVGQRYQRLYLCMYMCCVTTRAHVCNGYYHIVAVVATRKQLQRHDQAVQALRNGCHETTGWLYTPQTHSLPVGRYVCLPVRPYVRTVRRGHSRIVSTQAIVVVGVAAIRASSHSRNRGNRCCSLVCNAHFQCFAFLGCTSTRLPCCACARAHHLRAVISRPLWRKRFAACIIYDRCIAMIQSLSLYSRRILHGTPPYIHIYICMHMCCCTSHTRHRTQMRQTVKNNRIDAFTFDVCFVLHVLACGQSANFTIRQVIFYTSVSGGTHARECARAMWPLSFAKLLSSSSSL